MGGGGFKVGQQYRTNELSFKPGGYTVVVEEIGGRRFEYDKIKYPNRYISSVKRKSNVLDAWVKD
jgi:hypothetical protein